MCFVIGDRGSMLMGGRARGMRMIIWRFPFRGGGIRLHSIGFYRASSVIVTRGVNEVAVIVETTRMSS
jgi:hypothetical protein